MAVALAGAARRTLQPTSSSNRCGRRSGWRLVDAEGSGRTPVGALGWASGCQRGRPAARGERPGCWQLLGRCVLQCSGGGL